MNAIEFALASLVFAAALEVSYKRYSARARSRGMFVSGIGVVWGSLQLLLLTQQQAQPLTWDLAAALWCLGAGIAVTASNLLFIESLTHIDVSLGSTVYRLNTVVVVLLSMLFLSEAVGPMKLTAIVFGVGAALVMYRGTHHAVDVSLAQAFFWTVVLASVLRACFGVISKAALAHGVGYSSLLLTSAGCWVVGGLAYARFRERRVRITAVKIGYSVVAGTLVFLVVNTLLWGLERGEASTVIPIANLSFVVVLVVSVLSGMEKFSPRKGLAVCLAAACIGLMAMSVDELMSSLGDDRVVVVGPHLPVRTTSSEESFESGPDPAAGALPAPDSTYSGHCPDRTPIMAMRCGEATIELLARYGVDTVFGIPGVHTLEFCRGLGEGSAVRHIQTRHEQGAGFMADGYARASGKPGVALVISGPGVTNAATALGQAYADSVPLLLLSAEPASSSLGKGFGVLHEITEQKAVTAPLTALSATARCPRDVPDLLRQAFTIFSSQRPRPVHLSIPTDVLAMAAGDGWEAAEPPPRPTAASAALAAAADLLRAARRPLIMVGGGAVQAGDGLTGLARRLGAIVLSSSAGKGIVADSEPLSLAASTACHQGRRIIAEADVILAVGTELSETDSFVDRLQFEGPLIRIDIDVRKINDRYPARVGIVSDAGPAVEALLAALGPGQRSPDAAWGTSHVAAVRAEIRGALGHSQRQHLRLLDAIRDTVPAHTQVACDMCQLAYTGSLLFPTDGPRLWHYPGGFCTRGAGLPLAIGAKLASPASPVMVFAGDGGFLFTSQELITAAELGLPIPIVLWDNGGLKQIEDDMREGGFPLVGVQGINPDYVTLAAACHCHGLSPQSMDQFTRGLARAFDWDRPTLIRIQENAPWLI